MPGNIHLIIHDSIGVVSALVAATIAFFLLRNNWKKTVNATLALTNIAVLIFLVQDTWGASVSDPALATKILMWNIVVIWICAFNFHCVMAALNREKEKRFLIWTVYGLSLAFTAIFVFIPGTFILESVPKMYLPNYYVPGSLHLLFRIVFQGIIPIYFIYELLRAFRLTRDSIERNRYLYFAIAFVMGWGLGIIPDLLIFNIPVDPMWGLLFPICYSVPFTYAVLRYELIDIRVVAKKAFLYAIAIAVVGVIISLFDLANQFAREAYPSFPFWIMPLASAVLVVGAGILVWRELKESEILKYEFITTVTHKFRTPLTHIKWAAENLKQGGGSEADRIEQVGYIETANEKLVELTDLLAKASEADDNSYQYHPQRADFSAFVEESARSLADHAGEKNILVVKQIQPGLFASFDATRLRFVLQTLLENALNYTPAGGLVTVSVASLGKRIACSVKDSGIGIPKEDIPHIFTKLYRGKRARAADTEGMGIGLSISRSILRRMRGKIYVQSEGEDRGSTFSFSIPMVK